MKMFSKDGIEMMDMKKVVREGDIIIVKGKIMQSLNTSINLRPEDIWEGRQLLSWDIVWHIPGILIKGWIKTIRKKKEASTSYHSNN